jgi:hypothetical protein
MRVQLKRWMWSAAMLAVCGTAWPNHAGAADSFDEPALNSLLRVFTDSDRVSVRSLMGDYAFSLPRDAGLTVHWNNERVTVPAIDAAAGSQEAVDAITTASRPISGNAFQDFVKVRNEFQGGFAQGGIGLDYYYSTESDYLGQQIAARYNRDVMNDQLNVSMGTSYGWDAIEPVADDDTNTGADTKTTLHWNAIATRVLSPVSAMRFGLEYNLVNGLQHNPYRNVYAGGSVVSERHPDHRVRRDAFVKYNQYLPNRSSLRLGYRIYNDDWGIVSHETDTKLSQYISHGVFARYQYRYYVQSRADFFRDEYVSVDGIDGYRTGDYRLGSLSSHLFGFALNLDLTDLAANVPWLGRTEARFSYERYFNSNNYSANILETGLDFRF